jgi:hypothetical protein
MMNLVKKLHYNIEDLGNVFCLDISTSQGSKFYSFYNKNEINEIQKMIEWYLIAL